jgi:hypothetical protein
MLVVERPERLSRCLKGARRLGGKSPMMDEQVPPAREMTAYKQRRASGEVDRSPIHVRLCETMVYGTDSAKAKHLGWPINEPLTLEDAAELLGMRKRNARQVFRLPAFQRLYAQMVGAMRSAGHAKAIRRMIELVDEPCEGKAADRSVQLKASRALIGEADQALNVSVAIQTNIASEPAWSYAPCDRAPAPIIDATAAPVVERPEPEAFKRMRAIEARDAEQDRQQARAAELAANPIFRPLCR